MRFSNAVGVTISLLLAGREQTPTLTGRVLSGALACPSISLYVIAVGARETINGVPVTDEQIQAWADEAEAGFDADELKKRGRGRPGRGSEPAQVVALRLTAEELAELDALAAHTHQTRSELIRAALAAYAA